MSGAALLLTLPAHLLLGDVTSLLFITSLYGKAKDCMALQHESADLLLCCWLGSRRLGGLGWLGSRGRSLGGGRSSSCWGSRCWWVAVLLPLLLELVARLHQIHHHLLCTIRFKGAVWNPCASSATEAEGL